MSGHTTSTFGIMSFSTNRRMVGSSADNRFPNQAFLVMSMTRKTIKTKLFKGQMNLNVGLVAI